MATIRLIPSTYYLSNSSYLTVTNASNMYANTDSTDYATVYNNRSSTSSYYIYLRGFNFNSVPANAIINSFTVKFKAYESGVSTSTSYRPYLCHGTTTLTGSCNVITASTQTLTFTGVTADWDEISGYGDDFGIRINCRRNARNTAGYVYIYGAEILVDYTLPVYHTVTASSSNVDIDPSGAVSVLEGSSYSLLISGSDVTVTDNNVDVTDQLVEVHSASKGLVPDGTSGRSNFTISNESNAYAGSDNEAFDFTGFTVQTIMKLTGQDAIAKELLLPTAVVGNILRFTLPAEESVGMKSGVFETRYFKPDQSDVIEEVESVIIGRVTITKSPKPNVIPQEATP